MRLFAVFAVCALAAGTAAGATGKEPKKAIKPAAQAHAKRIAVRLRDLPGFGWKVAPAQTDRSKPRCSYYHPDQSKLTLNGEYASPDFTRSDGLYVSSSIGIFVSAKQAQTSFALVVRPELARCLGESVVRSGAPGHITLQSAGKLVVPRYGERSAGYRIVFFVKSGTSQVPATIDLIAVEKGAVDVVLFFSSAGEPVPTSFERRIAAAVVSRI